ncbi:MAG: hypothetical protein KBT47_08825 [Armatimonadetes bacterium]|nr:hypothetical protein [Candidatus Hippobium faecium]
MRKLILLLIVLLCCVCCCSKTEQVKYPIDADKSVYSLPEKMIFPDSSSMGLVIHSPFENTKDIGVEWVRIGNRWNFVEAKEGEFDWTEPDRIVDYYTQNGYKIMFVLGLEDMPQCYKDRKNDKDFIIERIGRFAKESAKHYKGKGFLWEISNEPEVFPMEGFMNDPVSYTKIARLCAKNIKNYDKSGKIAACSVAWFDPGFLTACFENGLLKDGTVDCISYHGYHRKDYLPESSLTEDIKWMRDACKKYSPKKYVSVVDSERGFGILDGDSYQPRHKDNWRNFVTCQSAQAAYLARHYLEEIYNQIELSVWYKDFHGETSYSLYKDGREQGLSPMGYVYKNIAFLFDENPMKFVNDRIKYEILGVNSNKLIKRSYLKKNKDGNRLIVAMWNPVESFDGKILEKRELQGDYFNETWRDVKPGDIVDVTASVTVQNAGNVRNVYVFDLLAKDSESGFKKADYELQDGKLIIKDVTCNAMPALVIIDM